MRTNDFDVVIVGGGLAGSLAALALRERRPALRIALIERGANIGGNHTWCFHAADLPKAAAPFVAPLIAQRWPGYTVRFPSRTRRLASPYAWIPSTQLAEVVHTRFADAPHCALLLGSETGKVGPMEVALSDGRTLSAALIVDARGPAEDVSGSDRGYQKFVGLELAVDPSAGLPSEPVMFDACLPQRDGFRFMYALPLARDRLLIEETFFSDTPDLDESQSVREILAYAKRSDIRVRDVVRLERGILPMPWRDAGFDPAARPLRAGYRAGLFHPVTGYSFPLAVRFAVALAESDLSSPVPAPLAAFARAQAAQRSYLQLLTRLLFTGFRPEERYRVLEHFYRLPEPLIARFFAAELGPLDRARIFLGAPPRGFSVGRALRAQQGATS